jgi:signal transduction histidine kinase
MKIFAIKDVKKLFVVIISILVCCITVGQVIVKLISDDYKKEMIAHDYAVAGYLSRSDLSESYIATAFTVEKTAGDISGGQEVLQAAGYKESINNNLLPQVRSFQQKYMVLAFVLSLTFSAVIIAVLLIFAVGLDRRLEKANADILSFMDGKHNVRLNDNEEGSLAQLYSSINTMATSLTTHIIKEKHNKEFLKNTIADISHQLKTPLAALKMYNEIIEDENTGNDVVESFTLKSRNELDRMENLIQNLLKLVRLDAGAITLEIRNYNLMDFLERATGRFLTRAGTENKLLTLNCDESIFFSCDEEWLFEAVSNIIKNALDHTESGDKVVIIGDKTPVATRITIKDNGSGIHPEDILSIFKRFYRSRFSQDKQGVGIGLTLSKSIVEKHGGTIMVESELGKGTTFHLAFPKLTNL